MIMYCIILCILLYLSVIIVQNLFQKLKFTKKNWKNIVRLLFSSTRFTFHFISFFSDPFLRIGTLTLSKVCMNRGDLESEVYNFWNKEIGILNFANKSFILEFVGNKLGKCRNQPKFLDIHLVFFLKVTLVLIWARLLSISTYIILIVLIDGPLYHIKDLHYV